MRAGYTQTEITARYGALDDGALRELMKAPCIFAYESPRELPPKFGFITNVVSRQGQTRIEYALHPIERFLGAQDLERMTFELDIGKMELYRTHWAVKPVNLPKELHAMGITLPSALRDVSNAVDVSKHVFDVALSFPGESRTMVQAVTQELERRLGPNSYFYDYNYVSQLSQPALDILLQGIYQRAKLNVVFLSGDYAKKKWCGVEFRVIREALFNRENNRIMYIRTDDEPVEGVLPTDGYIDSRNFDPDRLAEFICQRVELLGGVAAEEPTV